jgi:hypothetical protein
LLNNLNDSTRPKHSDALHKAVKNSKSAVAKVTEHRVVLIGDSHIQRYFEKVSNLSDDSYNVTVLTKPMANLAAITSCIDFSVDGYTKVDVIILSVARNETNNGLRHLTHFIHRTSSTNIILGVSL